MPNPIATLGVAAAIFIGGAGLVAAQDLERAVQARQSLMTLYGHYLGQLGAMAKGETPYDAAKAEAAATSLAGLATLDESAMWPEGSDNGALGDKTRALPVIWTTYPAITEKMQAAADATAALAKVAGTDLDSLRAGIGPVGKSCGDCHETYRAPKD
ncbi:cytochrome c [Pikeienuella sp. HZG-20]|uniref:c-type cytochrome n=1 Tax=Paludibacillus litoralis TaxID=3133267 RepID=UPI0030ED40D8